MALTKISGSILKDPLNLGEVSIGGTLTYQDVTNVDSIGLGTFRAGINVSGGQLDVGSNIKLGNAGIITATELDISGDIDVDGQTNLDNVSIAGVTTISEGVVTELNILSLVGTSWGDEEKVFTTYKRGSVHLGRFGVEADGAGQAGQLIFECGYGGSPVERLRITSDGKVGINTITPAALMHVSNSYAAPTGGFGGSVFSLISNNESTSDSCGLSINAGNAGVSFVQFGDTDDANVGTIEYHHSDNSMVFDTNASERLRINNNGHLGLNVTPGTWDNTFKALEGGGNSKHGQLFFQANGDWTTALGSNLYFNSGWKYRHTGAANWLEMKEDRTTFYMADSGSADSAITWLERLRIQSAGYITMPYQVAFFAYCSISNHDLNVGDKFQFNTLPSSGNVAVNSNHTTFGGTNVFNTSTNTFTAPVNGLYSFTVTAYYRRTGDPLTPLVPRVNNTQVTNGNNDVMFFANSDIVDGTTLSGTLILQLAANDAVTVHRRSHGTASSCRFYGPHSHFCGHLIG